MKTIDLTNEEHTVAELLNLARFEDVLIHSASGDDYLLERADEFEREAAALGASGKFMSFLQSRADEPEELTLDQVREQQIDGQ